MCSDASLTKVPKGPLHQTQTNSPTTHTHAPLPPSRVPFLKVPHTPPSFTVPNTPSPPSHPLDTHIAARFVNENRAGLGGGALGCGLIFPVRIGLLRAHGLPLMGEARPGHLTQGCIRTAQEGEYAPLESPPLTPPPSSPSNV